MNNTFDNYANYYDLLYHDKDYFEETKYVIGLIKKYSPDAEHLIEFGSGTGKHAALLGEAGYKLLGIEPSSTMLSIARKVQHPHLTFQEADLLTFKTAQQFDVALALFHVISYVNNNEDLFQVFQNIHRCIKPGGHLIFDVWYSPAILTQVPENRIKTVENDNLKIVRHAHPEIHWNSNVVDVNYEIEVLDKLTQEVKQVNEVHRMRHFSIPEIALLAKATGFELIHTEEFATGMQPGPNTWGICFILHKI
jgi:SAM-dependent methyltransferase